MWYHVDYLYRKLGEKLNFYNTRTITLLDDILENLFIVNSQMLNKKRLINYWIKKLIRYKCLIFNLHNHLNLIQRLKNPEMKIFAELIEMLFEKYNKYITISWRAYWEFQSAAVFLMCSLPQRAIRHIKHLQIQHLPPRSSLVSYVFPRYIVCCSAEECKFEPHT